MAGGRRRKRGRGAEVGFLGGREIPPHEFLGEVDSGRGSPRL